MIPIDSDRIWASNQIHWLDYEIIFPSIYGSLKTESRCVLGVRFIAELVQKAEADSNLNWTGPPTWLGRPWLPPKVVAKVEVVLEHLLGVLHLLGA
jgi:hypothetical protein